jgi:predicted GNAT superfamily acetyltransferase
MIGDSGSPAGAHPLLISPDDIEIRLLRTNEEYRACVGMQKQIWGAGFTEQVPLAILKVAQRIGGVTAGAFNRDGRMIGFVFGLTGVERGRLVHWSDILAVLPEARDRGVGRRLKEFQRSQLVAIRVERMYWTFDPLVARNAHLNLAVLGAAAVEYIIDMYGSYTSSNLHVGIGTDRLLVAWSLLDGNDNLTPGLSGSDAVPLLLEVEGRPIRDLAVLSESGPTSLSIEVPADITAIHESSVAAATEWRIATREAFTAALDRGWRIDTFVRATGVSGGRYLLGRPPE